MKIFGAGVLILVGAACSSSSPADKAATNLTDGGATDDSSVVTDAPLATDGSATDSSDGACSNVVHPNVDQNIIDGLTKVIGLWRWSKLLSSGSESPLDDCDKSTHYRIGPEAFVGGATAGSYAACILKQGGVVPLSSGRLSPPDGCQQLSCGANKLGVLWSTATSGTVFELDANGKPKGTSVMTLTIRPSGSGVGYDLLWGGPTGQNGYIMNGPDVGDKVVLACP